MVREQYVDKIVELIELGVPVADTRIEVEKLLKQYFVAQLTEHANQIDEQHAYIEEQVRRIERGESL